MNKAELIESIQGKLGGDTSKREAGDALSAVLDAIVEGVKKDEAVQIIGVGTFKLTRRPARDGINPRTKEKIRISASKSISFKPSAALKKSL